MHEARCLYVFQRSILEGKKTMSMTVGDLIRPDDVPDAIKTAVQTAIAGYTSSYKTLTISQTELLNNVNDKITDFKTNAEETEEITNDPYNGVTGKRIKPYAVLNLIYASMRQACRLGTISYSYYSNTGYVNSPGYTPPVVSQSLKVLFGTVDSEVPNVATYCSKVAAKYPRVSDNGTLTSVE